MAYVRPIGFWLKLVDALVDDAYTRILEEHGVTRVQWQMLDAMDASSTTTAHLDTLLQPFAAHGEVSAVVTDHLDELLDSGWVQRDGDVWSLTPTGRSALDSLEAAVAVARDRALSGIPAEKYDGMLDVLEQLAANYGYRATA